MQDHGGTHRGESMRGMAQGDEDRMLHKHHQGTIWVFWAVIFLGFWMITSPLTFDYSQGAASPAGGRAVWLPLEARITALAWSDIISGFLLVVLGFRALTPDRPYTVWAACFVGVWLSFAPLVFWSPSALVYLNDTLGGFFVMALTVIIPGMPNMMRHMEPGPEVPPGWSYNPSSASQRSILAVLGLGGWLFSRYLAAYELGYIDTAYDPFFGDGTRKVLTSHISESMPIPDAGLGALAYTVEFLMAFMGDKMRWRTMPWMVLLFGLLVIPLGLVHIILVSSQPVVVGYWCAFCLAAALCMLPMIPLEVDEVVAMGQFMADAKRKGNSLWRAFWYGGTMEGGSSDGRSPEVSASPRRTLYILRASLWGASLPWSLALSSALGVWLMAAPRALGTGKPAADIEHICGALLITVSVSAMAEPARAARFINVAIGSALVVGGVFFQAELPGRFNDVLSGLAVAALSIPRGRINEHYGGWDRLIK